MKGAIVIRKQIERRISFLKKEKGEAVKKLADLPGGKLVVVQNGGYTKWYVSEAGKLEYIPKKRAEYAESLLKRKLLECDLRAWNREDKLLASLLDFYEKSEAEKQDIVGSSKYSKLYSNISTESFADSVQWKNESYVKCEKYPERLVHRACDGTMVRSKSEVLIVSELCRYGVPFHYEEQLLINDMGFYPDFTLKNSNNETIYWEHFGMMDDLSYVRNAYHKLEIYASAGIIPDVNLIVTFETREHPLDLDIIDQKISNMLL